MSDRFVQVVLLPDIIAADTVTAIRRAVSKRIMLLFEAVVDRSTILIAVSSITRTMRSGVHQDF